MEFLIFMGVVFSVVGCVVCLSFLPRTVAILGIGYAAIPHAGLLSARWGDFGSTFAALLVLFYGVLVIASIIDDIVSIRDHLNKKSAR